MLLAVVDEERLVAAAVQAHARAYAPYSHFHVGAAVLGVSGRIYSGCNVENASYGATICAERSAVCAMVAGGDTQMLAIALYTLAEPVATPCGICRQVIGEFASDETLVVAVSPREKKSFSFASLLPERFVLVGQRSP
jgi:cytidine deaminase